MPWRVASRPKLLEGKSKPVALCKNLTLLKTFLQWPYVLVFDISSMNMERFSGEAGKILKLKKMLKYSHCLMWDNTLFLVEVANRNPCVSMFCVWSCSQKAEIKDFSPRCSQLKVVCSGLDQYHFVQPELGEDLGSSFLVKAAADVIGHLILFSPDFPHNREELFGNYNI